MTLASLKFIPFFAAAALGWYLLPGRARRWWLLAASYGFYALWQPAFALLLAASTLVVYFCARGGRRCWTAVGAVWLFGVLFCYKYLHFVLNGVLGLDAAFTLAQPVGISFYTFAAASYLFDVRRGTLVAERNIVDLALCFAFFPTLLSGPINRAAALLPQLKNPPHFRWDALRRGLLRFAAGAAKKLVLADLLGIFVNAAYADVYASSGGVLLAAAVAYSLQIYFDFAGYTDMALGAAEMLGLRCAENFDAPYLTRTVRGFWRGWHQSLTGWFRDYIYFPLGGSRGGAWRTWRNTMIVFAVSGVWHGAGWSFLCWGLLNGAYQVAGQMTAPLRRRLRSALRIPENGWLYALWQGLFTFGLITAAWVLFRLPTVGEAVFVWKRVALILRDGFGAQSLLTLIGKRRLCVIALSLAVFTAGDILRRARRLPDAAAMPPFVYWLLLAAFAALIAVFGVYGAGFDAQSFVYFQF